MCWDLPAVAAARTTCRDQHGRAAWVPVLEAWVPVLYASGEAVCIVGSSIYMIATFAGGCPEACGLVGKQVVDRLQMLQCRKTEQSCRDCHA